MIRKGDLVQRLFLILDILKGLGNLLQAHIFDLTMFEWIFDIMTHTLLIRKDI